MKAMKHCPKCKKLKRPESFAQKSDPSKAFSHCLECRQRAVERRAELAAERKATVREREPKQPELALHVAPAGEMTSETFDNLTRRLYGALRRYVVEWEVTHQVQDCWVKGCAGKYRWLRVKSGHPLAIDAETVERGDLLFRDEQHRPHVQSCADPIAFKAKRK